MGINKNPDKVKKYKSKNTNHPAEGISIDRWKIYFEKLSKSEETHDKPPDHVSENLCTSENFRLTDEKVRFRRNELNKRFQTKENKTRHTKFKKWKVSRD